MSDEQKVWLVTAGPEMELALIGIFSTESAARGYVGEMRVTRHFYSPALWEFIMDQPHSGKFVQVWNS